MTATTKRLASSRFRELICSGRAASRRAAQARRRPRARPRAARLGRRSAPSAAPAPAGPRLCSDEPAPGGTTIVSTAGTRSRPESVSSSASVLGGGGACTTGIAFVSAGGSGGLSVISKRTTVMLSSPPLRFAARDQLLRGGVEVVPPRFDDAEDRLVVDHRGQAVRADEEDVAGAGLDREASRRRRRDRCRARG